MSVLLDVEGPTVAEMFDDELHTRLRYVEMPLIAELWQGFTFVTFASLKEGSFFKVAGLDCSQSMLTGFEKISPTSCQKMVRDIHGRMSITSFVANVRHKEQGCEESGYTYHRLEDDMLVVLKA